MPKRVMAGLSARRVQTEKRSGLWADGAGLYLQVTNTGMKSWIFRFQLAGRRRDMGLGSVDDVSLAAARVAAADARALVRDKVDPIEARAAGRADAVLKAAKAMTFKAAAEACIASMRSGWKNAKHAGQWETTLERYVYPDLGELAVGAVDTGLVLKCLEPIWSTKTETASRVRGRIESVLDYAKVRGWRQGENPARWKGHLDQVLAAKADVAKPRHHASLPYDSMPGWWPKLQMQDGMGARALEFGILTAARPGEALGARWSEINMDAATWTIPAERMKAGAEHVVPLSEPAMALLSKLEAVKVSGYVFPGRGSEPMSNMAMAATLRRMKSGVTAHGFRATFRTWIDEQTNTPHEVAEAALAHTIDSKTERAYRRGAMLARRRELMTAWANFVEGRGADVVPMRREAR